MSCDSAATTKVFSCAILLINLSLVATAAAAVWRYDNLVQALLVGGDAGGHLPGGFIFNDLFSSEDHTLIYISLYKDFVKK